MDQKDFNSCRDCKYRKGSCEWEALMECKAITTLLGGYENCYIIRKETGKICPYWKERFSLIKWFKRLQEDY
jgi:hypothetical protein